MNLGVKPQTQEGVVECFFVSDVTTQKWGGLGIGGSGGGGCRPAVAVGLLLQRSFGVGYL